MTRRLGLLGGSFDPIHIGHLALAGAAQRNLELEQVFFVPAAQNPLKPPAHGGTASDEQRLQMLKLALEVYEAYSVCDVELARGGISYTVDTLRWFREQHADAELYLLLGADAALTLAEWKQIAEFNRLCTLAIAGRPGAPGTLEELTELLARLRLPHVFIDMPPVMVSSSAIRECIAHGRQVGHLLPAAVAEYIAEQRLYRQA